jgi:hypothetical protein
MTKSFFYKETKRLNSKIFDNYKEELDKAMSLLGMSRSIMQKFVPVLNSNEPGFVLFQFVGDAEYFKGEFISVTVLDEQINKTQNSALVRIKERIDIFQKTKIYYPFAAQVGRAIISASVAEVHPEVEHISLFEDSYATEVGIEPTFVQLL